MAACELKTNKCTSLAVRVVQVRGRALNACPPCSRGAWIAEYRSQWEKGIAFDRGAPEPGWQWALDTVPPPWIRDDLDPRTEEEQAKSRKRRGL